SFLAPRAARTARRHRRSPGAHRLPSVALPSPLKQFALAPALHSSLLDLALVSTSAAINVTRNPLFLRDLQFLCFIYLIYLLYFLLQSGLYPYQIAPSYNGLFQRSVDSFSTTVPKKSKYRVDASHLQNLISYY